MKGRKPEETRTAEGRDTAGDLKIIVVEIRVDLEMKEEKGFKRLGKNNVDWDQAKFLHSKLAQEPERAAQREMCIKINQ